MKVLVACEESQRVCLAFRERGFEAYSCDIKEQSGGYPAYHIQGDVLPLLDPHNVGFTVFTNTGKPVDLPDKWDIVIAHPPCTFLSDAAGSCISDKVHDIGYIKLRYQLRLQAALFFMQCYYAVADHVAVENPKGAISNAFRQPDQYINPSEFCTSIASEDFQRKRTGLWLRNLPPLVARFDFRPSVTWVDKVTKDRSTQRSKTFKPIAEAMAEQWGNYAIAQKL